MSGKSQNISDVRSAACSVEHHATLFALIAKHAVESFADRGKDAVLEAVTKYAYERGRRMAMTAEANGDKTDLVGFLAYGEWRVKSGTMNSGAVAVEPSFVSYTDKCAWNDVWTRHGLEDYGRYYCLTVDDAIFRGFNSSFSAKVISNLTWGADRCVFDWGIPLSAEDAERLESKKAEIGDKYVRDFDYHSAHLASTMGRELERQLGRDGESVVEGALASFREMFGEAALEAVISCASGEFGWSAPGSSL